MSSSTKTNQTSTANETTMPVTPSNVTGAINSQLSNITALGAVPATSYVAPQTGLQLQANQQGAATLNGTNPNYTTAAGDISGNASLTPSAISSYLSPYLSQVLGTTNQQLQQNAGVQDANLEAQGAASGAFGGSRFGVAQGVLGGQQQLAEGQTDANIENTGYQSAISSALSNAQLGQSAGVNLANVGTAENASNIANIAELAQLGGAEQATNQAEATAPIALAQAQGGLLANLPLSAVVGSTSNGTGTTTGTTTNSIGLLQALLGTGGISGLLQGGGGAASGASSLISAFAPA